MNPYVQLLSLFKLVKQRFSERADSEHEQAVLRIIVGLVFTVYLLPKGFVSTASVHFLLVLIVFQVLAWTILASIVRWPGISPVRRIFGAAVDSATATYFMVETGVEGLPLF